MKLTNFNYPQVGFKAAQVNIVAMSDNHGNVQNLPQLVGTIDKNKGDIFKKADEKSTLNMFAIAGDFFMNPHKKGYMTKPELSNGDIQANFLQKVVNTVKGIVKNNFDTVYSLGNHCYDGGDEFVFNKLKDEPVKTLVTNVDLEKSPLVTGLMKNHKNIVTSQVYEVQDDKNPNLKHDVMFVGVTIPSLKGKLTKTELYDNCNKKDTQLTEDDLQGTFAVLNKEVEAFKEKHPKGAVVLLSHMGAPISKMIQKNVPNINVILNGHDHTRDNAEQGGTIITSLGKDNEIIKSVNFRFNDDGDLEDVGYNMYITENSAPDKEVKTFLDKNFEEDVKPLVKMHGASELEYSDKIRYANTELTNFLTSTVAEEARKEIPDLASVALQSSYVRGGIKEGSTNLNLLKIFDGIDVESQNLNVGNVKGNQLVDIISKNVKSNLEAPTRNTLIQWSDFQVNRTMIEQIAKGESKNSYADAVKCRNQETGKFENIDLNKDYKVILSNKILSKKDFKEVKDNFESINKNYDDFFRANIKGKNYEVNVDDRVKEKRVL